MTRLDDELVGAASDLRTQFERVEPPPFKPKRSALPAALVVLGLVSIAVFGLVARSRSIDSGVISVATQPEISQSEVSQAEVNATPGSEPIVTLGEDALLGPDGEPAGQATPVGRSYSVTSAQPGEFIMPLPMANGWNEDQVRLVVYRTGDVEPGHQVIDTLDRDAEPISLPFRPADIEQVYWNPLDGEQLAYTNGADLMIFDLRTMESTVEETFENCDRVDSGVLPVPPASDGTLSLLCHLGASSSQITYQLATSTVQRAQTESDSAAFPSPSGENLVRWNADGSASVLDRSLTETGVVLDLANNSFGFVTDTAGREWVVSTLFDGSVIGSAVVLPLDGRTAPIVLIGPERGDVYPPSGTLISSSGDKIALSVRGADDGELAGRVTLLDLSTSFSNPSRRSIAHGSQSLHGYWSTPFVSVSPLGVIAYSTDGGRDAVNTMIASFVQQSEPSD